MKHHDRPWKCSIQDCEYAEGGFLSRKMRDNHYRDHVATGPQELPHRDNPEADEIQPLLFDLVKADRVDAVRNLLDQVKALPKEIRDALRECAVSFGSPAMIDLIQPFEEKDFPENTLKSCIRAANIDLFKHLLLRSKKCQGTYSAYSYLITQLLMSDSEEFFQEWERYIDVEPKVKGYRQYGQDTLEPNYFTLPEVIKATAGHPGRENLLIRVWEKVGVLKSFNQPYLGSAVVNVASTTCSIKLAKYFIDHGAEVDFRRSEMFLTPLHHAARQNSAAAAEMMKYLLEQGANPKLKAGRAHLNICDEKGSRGIARWLGMSWDELVAKTKEEREKMAGKGKDSIGEQEKSPWLSSLSSLFDDSDG
jgi:Ankyrin repeat